MDENLAHGFISGALCGVRNSGEWREWDGSRDKSLVSIETTGVRMSSDKKTLAKKLIPFSLTAAVIVIDQAVKAFIAANWPINTIVKKFFLDGSGDGILEIWHVRNKAIAFSLGRNMPEGLRPIFFVALPFLVLVFLVWYYMTSSEFTKLQRWAVAGIVGGGLGNLIDRVLRPDGVVDFVSVKFYGFLGLERWPTFNVADSSVVVCVFLWLLSMLLGSNGWRSKKK
jgi:signal peptidase II